MASEGYFPDTEGVVVKCESCAAVFKNFKWKPGMKCPKCGSEDFAPATIIEGAVDYSVADRRKGYAIEDIRFGKLAQWAGLITAFQYNQALAKMKSIANSGQKVPHIGKILIDAGLMKESDMKAVLEVYCKPRPAEDDNEFARVAVQNKFVAEDRIEDLQILQKEMRAKGAMVPPLAVLCFEKRLIPEAKILAILQAQQRRATGPIHEIHAIIEANRPPTTLEKYIGKKGDPMRKYRAAGLIAGGLALILTWLWYYGFIGGGQDVGYYCTACKKCFIAGYKKEVPIKCRYCGKKTAIYGFICGKCGKPYGVSDRDGPKYCPYCRSGYFREITKESLKRLEEREKRRKRSPEEEKESLYKLRKTVE